MRLLITLNQQTMSSNILKEKIIGFMRLMNESILIATFDETKRKDFETLILKNPELSLTYVGALEGQIKLIEHILAGVERK